jgi:uncharacterized Zn-finger protein
MNSSKPFSIASLIIQENQGDCSNIIMYKNENRKLIHFIDTMTPYPSPTNTAASKSIYDSPIKESKDFKCVLEGCGKSFSKRYNMQSHMKCHSGTSFFPLQTLYI